MVKCDKCRTHCHHSLAWQTGSSGCRSRHCYKPSSSTRTRWPHEALPGTRPRSHWCARSAMTTFLQRVFMRVTMNALIFPHWGQLVGIWKGGLTFRPELQGDSTDWTASVGPALQIEARVAGVDVGEHWLILVELRLCQQNKQISILSCV